MLIETQLPKERVGEYFRTKLKIVYQKGRNDVKKEINEFLSKKS